MILFKLARILFNPVFDLVQAAPTGSVGDPGQSYGLLILRAITLAPRVPVVSCVFNQSMILFKPASVITHRVQLPECPCVSGKVPGLNQPPRRYPGLGAGADRVALPDGAAQ